MGQSAEQDGVNEPALWLHVDRREQATVRSLFEFQAKNPKSRLEGAPTRGLWMKLRHQGSCILFSSGRNISGGAGYAI